MTIDFAKILRLDRQAATIVIGNPGIADATVEDEKTIVLTGKAAGTTNLIVLDEEGEEIVNAQVRVSSNVQQLTTVFYGGERQTFSCAPTCEQVILVGDDPGRFHSRHRADHVAAAVLHRPIDRFHGAFTISQIKRSGSPIA